MTTTHKHRRQRGSFRKGAELMRVSWNDTDLEKILADGWEPIAVTDSGEDEIVWLRRGHATRSDPVRSNLAVPPSDCKRCNGDRFVELDSENGWPGETMRCPECSA